MRSPFIHFPAAVARSLLDGCCRIVRESAATLASGESRPVAEATRAKRATGSERETASAGRETGRECERRRADLRVLLVGPVRATGGIARYIEELRTRLPAGVAVAVYDTAAPPGTGPIRFARGALGALWDVLRFPFHERPDVVHVNTAEHYSFLRKSAYVLLTRYLWDRPVILHIHGPTFDRFVAEASGPLRALQRTVFEASTAVVVLSPYWKESLEPYLPAGKVVVLPNAIDTAEYTPQFDHERAHVVFVSNHVPRKGIREFTEAVSRLVESGADVRVTIAGSGPLDGHAKRLAATYDEVEYLGYVSEGRKREVLCAASIYVLPAYAEGLPIGVLEGMAGGNAVVATAVGGVPDAVSERGGTLVPPKDTEALTGALSALIDAPERASEMGRYNAARVETYTWAAVLPRLLDLYESVTAGRS